MQISRATLKELQHAACDGPMVRLRTNADPVGAEGAHKVLTRSGATWSVRHRSYVFSDLFPFGQAAALVSQILDLRCAVNRPDRGVVSCPQSIAETLWAGLDEVQPESEVLEPSAGHGVLAAEGTALGHAVDCYEIDIHRAADITRAGIARNVTTTDFLTVTAQPAYDAVVMYPPHRRDLAIKHVLQAYRFLRPGGILAALVSRGVQNAAGERGEQFRELISRAGYLRVLDEADFDDGYLLSPTGLRIQAQLLYLYADAADTEEATDQS
ncbi:class I SAM-dependent methyltransferase [Streptomyces sp. NBC_01433]|uniref:SAM-dependent methyltransferase n=1 Tax=Streptomyces sp. NBC_01433 TaxID=2903864 RepID=UPI00225061D2|nr:SAM-dependent methyltransferase [Streptomyces sp. NBC_01433]MCX4681670.1 class I SAM-dependent methyltransferase [Streptomyces sp. NBC_01433]